MVKILPIENIKTSNITKKLKPTVENTSKSHAAEFIKETIPIAATGLILSTFYNNYQKTVDNNYFCFKINPETDEPYKPDVFQNAAAMNIYLGNDVLVTAPTGTGKTAIAEYTISKNLQDGLKTFYTAPLKALSNEKYLEFCRIYGEENVGLITGDIKINKNAPIIVMTTEVYRNMAAANKFDFDRELKGIPDDLKTVIFDELQYLGDVDRGGVWEQSLMFTPKNVQILSLSATIGNNKDINNWIALLKGYRSETTTPDKNYRPDLSKDKKAVLINVPPSERHVPLMHQIIQAVPEIKAPKVNNKKQRAKLRMAALEKSQSDRAKIDDSNFRFLTRQFYNENKLPAIYFIFSKKECKRLLKYLSTQEESLNNEAERKEVDETIRRYKKNRIYLGENLDTEALKKGYAVHNAGLLPSQKRLIEELFQKKLVKVVLATETLSAGINMPAKTVLITSPQKPTSLSNGQDRKRNLSPNEFHQISGRAGRRGIDTIGYAYALSLNMSQDNIYNELISTPCNNLESNLKLDYAFIMNYIREFKNEEELKYILSRSFYGYDKNTKTFNSEKIDNLINNFQTKKNILIEDNFVSENGTPTLKGEMLRFLNGYEQIPIINTIVDNLFLDLDPIQAAGIIAGLACIEEQGIEEPVQNALSVELDNDLCLTTAFGIAQNNLLKYNSSSASINNGVELQYNTKALQHVLKWAELNSKNPEGKENWKEICTGDLKYSIKDEGTLFKEINATCDLLKQLILICSRTASLSEMNSQRIHIEELKEKLTEALQLLQREPIAENNL